MTQNLMILTVYFLYFSRWDTWSKIVLCFSRYCHNLGQPKTKSPRVVLLSVMLTHTTLSTFILRRIMWGRGFVDFCGRKQLQLDYERPCSIDYRSFIQPPCISLFLQVQYSNQENCINLCYPGINEYVVGCSWSHCTLQIWEYKNTDIWDRNIVCT